MGIKWIYGGICFYVVLIMIACECKEDKYGESLKLIVPITTSPLQDTFAIDDTLWITANFEKDVSINNSALHIRLDSFNFFTELEFSEISDTASRYNFEFDTIVEIGELHYLPLQTAVVYPIIFEEDTDHYKFKAGIILKSPGLYLLGFSTPSFLYEESYEHPAVFVCENNKRDEIIVNYYNTSTSLDTYNRLFLSTNVGYLKELVDFDRYSHGGAITFFVKP